MTLSIRVELLTGRYTATSFDDRGQAEWPPHPARLFSALVDTWAVDGSDGAERDALAWLERQKAPSITCSDPELVAHRDVLTHFVPVNDATTLARDQSASYERIGRAMLDLEEAERSGKPSRIATARRRLDKALAKARDDAANAGALSGKESDSVATLAMRVLPEHRLKQARTFPTVTPDEPRFWFTWSDADPEPRHREALEGILARLGRLGHSSSLVCCDIDDDPPPPMLVPRPGGRGTVRIPAPGVLAELEADFQVHRGVKPRVAPYPAIQYVRPATPPLSRPLLGGDWLVLGLPTDRPRLYLPSVLGVARAVRAALIRHSPAPVPPVISGHRESADGRDTEPLEQPHLAVVPLANVGHRHADGRILGVALVLPRDTGEAEREALGTALRNWQEANQLIVYNERWSLELAEIGWSRDERWGTQLRSLTKSYWCRPSHRWASVTPIGLDRHPGLLRADRPDRWETAVADVRTTIERSCQMAGLPEPTWIGVRLDGPLASVPAAPGNGRGRCFPGFRTGSGAPRIGVHVELEFAEQVSGPVLIGAGRYFGYGLCLPVDDREERQWSRAS